MISARLFVDTFESALLLVIVSLSKIRCQIASLGRDEHWMAF